MPYEGISRVFQPQLKDSIGGDQRGRYDDATSLVDITSTEVTPQIAHSQQVKNTTRKTHVRTLVSLFSRAVSHDISHSLPNR